MESWITPMINPTATICMEVSAEMPSREQAIGINSREPPATPEVPHAASVEISAKRIAIGKGTDIPNVCANVSDMIVMTTAAPSILIVEPRGMETE